MTDIAVGFRDIDHQADDDAFKTYLAEVADRLADQKEDSINVLLPRPGEKLLDVGCGLGRDVQRLAHIVGPSGQAVGLDRSEAMIDAAGKTIIGSANVAYAVGDTHALPFPDDWFDGARADRTLQHVDNPAAVLKEMLRVVRPGGRIAVTEPDWGSLIIDTSDPAAELHLVVQLRDRKTRNGKSVANSSAISCGCHCPTLLFTRSPSSSGRTRSQPTSCGFLTSLPRRSSTTCSTREGRHLLRSHHRLHGRRRGPPVGQPAAQAAVSKPRRKA